MALNGVRHAKKRAFLAAYSKCGVVKVAAQAAGINRTLHYHWMHKDEAYATAFRDAHEDACDVLEAEAVRRATIGGSDTMLIFMLKAMRPAKYRERYEVSGPAGAPIEIKLSAEDEAIASRIASSRLAPTEN